MGFGDDIEVQIGADNKAKRILESFSGDIDRFNTRSSKKFRESRKEAGMFTKELKAMAAAAGLVTIPTVTTEMARIDEVAKTSRKLGVFTDELIGLRLAANEFSGMADSSVDMALQRMTKRISEAAEGTGEAQGALQELTNYGLRSAAQLNAAGPGVAIKEIADALSKVESQSDRVRLASKLFDSEGVSLVTTLQEGSGALVEMEQRAHQLGLTFTDLEAERVEAANDAIHELKMTFKGLATDLAVEVAPELKNLANLLSEITEEGGETRRFMRWLQESWQKVGVSAAQAWMDMRGEDGDLAPTLSGQGFIDSAQNVVDESLGRAADARDAARKRELQEAKRHAAEKVAIEQEAAAKANAAWFEDNVPKDGNFFDVLTDEDLRKLKKSADPRGDLFGDAFKNDSFFGLGGLPRAFAESFDSFRRKALSDAAKDKKDIKEIPQLFAKESRVMGGGGSRGDRVLQETQKQTRLSERQVKAQEETKKEIQAMVGQISGLADILSRSGVGIVKVERPT